jgi:hypothetical protein
LRIDMIGKLFGAPKRAATPALSAAQRQWSEAMRAGAGEPQLADTAADATGKPQADPLATARIGGREVFHRLYAAMRNERGVHVESMLCVLGALAGYACQAEVRAIARAKNLPDDAVFQIVSAVDGRRYYFGELLNQPLLNAQPSLWGMAAAAATRAGAAGLPDPHALFRHVAASVGSDAFGVPRVPTRHKAGDTPRGYLKQLWPALFPLVRKLCPDPALWPVVFGMAIGHTIEAAQGTIDPALAFTIVMEAAVPMSKVDLEGS